jgi:hypothetical protein
LSIKGLIFKTFFRKTALSEHDKKRHPPSSPGSMRPVLNKVIHTPIDRKKPAKSGD